MVVSSPVWLVHNDPNQFETVESRLHTSFESILDSDEMPHSFQNDPNNRTSTYFINKTSHDSYDQYNDSPTSTMFFFPSTAIGSNETATHRELDVHANRKALPFLDFTKNEECCNFLADRDDRSNENRRRVTFLVDEYDSILADIHLYEYVPSTMHSTLYWTDDEQDQSRKNAYKVVDSFLHSDQENLVNDLCNLNQFIKQSFWSPVITDWEEYIATSDIGGIVGQWTKSDGRGLESWLNPTISSNSKIATKKVLQYQLRLHRSEAHDNDLLMMQYLLSKEYKRYSNNSCRFARLMAIGDSMIANMYYCEMFNTKNDIPKQNKPNAVLDEVVHVDISSLSSVTSSTSNNSLHNESLLSLSTDESVSSSTDWDDLPLWINGY